MNIRHIIEDVGKARISSLSKKFQDLEKCFFFKTEKAHSELKYTNRIKYRP